MRTKQGTFKYLLLCSFLIFTTTIFAATQKNTNATPPKATTTAKTQQERPIIPIELPKQAAHSGVKSPVLIPPPPKVGTTSYVLMAYNSGYIIDEKNPNERLPPASLTKMMTSYVVSAALKNGQIQLNDMVPISEKAWRTGGSRMFVRVNTKVPLKDLIHGMIVASGNDACVALSQYVAGSEKAFTNLMNETAKKLGMKNSHFTDATGLPHPDHYSTAHDLAILARALIKNFPRDYKWYKQKYITWNGIRQPNRNRLLWIDPYVDGIKTGHTKEAGYCLVASGKKDGMRLISVVMGAPTAKKRITDSQALLTYGFRFYRTHKLFSKDKGIISPRIWYGKEKYAPMGVAKNFYVTFPIGQYNNLKAYATYDKKFTAPIVKGDRYGTVVIELDGKKIATRPLVALSNDPKGGIFVRIRDHIAIMFKRWFHENQSTL